MVRYLALVAGLLGVGSASAATITLGTYELVPNQAGQTITISVAGASETVYGMNLYAEIGGGTAGPSFQGVDVDSTGMVFDAALPANVAEGVDLNPRYSIAYVTPAPPTSFTPNTTLVTFTVDTTGYSSGSYTFKLNDFAVGGNYEGFSTEFLDSASNPVSITFSGNGLITFQEEVPEPTSMFMMAALMVGGVPAMLVYRRRRKAATPAAVS